MYYLNDLIQRLYMMSVTLLLDQHLYMYIDIRIVYDWSTFHTFLWSYSYKALEEQVQYAEYVKKIS